MLEAEVLGKLQKRENCIRNICIVAHVDHGKTSLADCLIASNGIVSQRLAGKIRYMDSREDEQTRGITMKSSSISLVYKKEEEDPLYLVNLIDSPGHVDFSSEICTAVRLCDGAIVVVDVVEGVCTQTHAVLRQAWEEGLKLVLVLNKIDRLIVELKMSPSEAYDRIVEVIGQVNAITGHFYTQRLFSVQETSTEPDIEPDDEEDVQFCPSLGNVIFASAADGWAFSINQFASFYGAKLGMNERALQKALWGDYYYLPKAKKVVKGAKNAGPKAKPMFVQFVLANLWQVYETIYTMRGDMSKLEAIVSSLKIKVPVRELRSKDPKIVVSAIMPKWLPCSEACLRLVVDKLPSPVQAQREPNRELLHPWSWEEMSRHRKNAQSRGDTAVQQLAGSSGVSRAEVSEVSEDEILKCDQHVFDSVSALDKSDDAPVFVYVAKLYSVPDDCLPREMQIAKRNKRAAAAAAASLSDDIRSHPPSADAAGPSPVSPTNGATATQEVASASTSVPQDASSGCTAVVCPQPAEGAEGCIATASASSATAATTSASESLCEPRGAVAIKPTTEAQKPALSPLTQAVADEEEEESFVAFARVLSGTLRKGQKLYVLGAYYDPRVRNTHCSAIIVDALYLMMGRSLESLDSVPAGNVCGIGGLDGHVLKTATLSSIPYVRPLRPLTLQALPIMRVAVEPRKPADMKKLTRGLRLLHQSDPCVETLVTEAGNHVIVAMGELHLETCLKDLKERYARIPLAVSAPIVPFREGLAVEGYQETPEERETKERDNASMGTKYLGSGLYEVTTPNRAATIRVSTRALPLEASRLLEENPGDIQQLVEAGVVTDVCHSFRKSLLSAGSQWEKLLDRLICFGPKRVGPNILVSNDPNLSSTLGGLLLGKSEARAPQPTESPDHPQGTAASNQGATASNQGSTANDQVPVASASSGPTGGRRVEDDVTAVGSGGVGVPSAAQTVEEALWQEVRTGILSGFQVATSAGPLCDEPMFGVCVVVESIRVGAPAASAPAEVSPAALDQEKGGSVAGAASVAGRGSAAAAEGASAYGPLGGQAISAMRTVCRQAFLGSGPRLIEAQYACEIQTTADALGKVYGVLNRRRGQITHEEMREGTPLFMIKSHIPVVESFGLATELRSKCSGAASAQLVFSHWQPIPDDPFWVPRTEEEMEDFGTYNRENTINFAKKYIDAVRKRKGLRLEKKIVEHAEKQRNLARKR
eukprot:Rmarinus@m.18833